jgi:hypothetical protein
MRNYFVETGGNILRLINDVAFAIGAGTVSANSSNRGVLARTEGGESEADTFAVILKNADDEFVPRFPFFTASDNETLDVDADRIRVRESYTPASAEATCSTGEIVWDADAIYVCVDEDTWKKVDIETWGE